MTTETKTCRRCLEDKPIDAFTLDKGRPKSTCKPCVAEQWRLWHGDKKKANKERRENQNFRRLMANWLPPGKLPIRQAS